MIKYRDDKQIRFKTFTFKGLVSSPRFFVNEVSPINRTENLKNQFLHMFISMGIKEVYQQRLFSKQVSYLTNLEEVNRNIVRFYADLLQRCQA